MIRRVFWEVAAACALVWLGTYGTKAVMSLEKKQPQPVARFEPRMVHPVQCDATMSSRGAGEKWTRPACYVRRDR